MLPLKNLQATSLFYASQSLNQQKTQSKADVVMENILLSVPWELMTAMTAEWVQWKVTFHWTHSADTITWIITVMDSVKEVLYKQYYTSINKTLTAILHYCSETTSDHTMT